MSKIKLPITVDIPTTSYFAISLPLSVILSHEETKEWYYENFINIYAEKAGNLCFADMSFGMLARYNTVFEYTVSKYEDTQDTSIVERLRHEIFNERNYAYLYVDEYYISCKSAYQNNHFHHQALIYGFDDDRRVFNAIAFDTSKHFAELEYGYDEVEKGYSAGFLCEWERNETFGVIFFKICPNFSHKLYFPNVINALQEYINGSVPRNIRYIQHNMEENSFVQDEQVAFGTNAICRAALILKESMPENFAFVDFRRVHFLYEHAKMLLDRVKYYIEYFQMDDGEYTNLVDQYAGIVQRYQKARMVFLKLRLINKQGYTENSRIEKLRDSIVDTLTKIYPDEKRILANILSCMLKWNAQDDPFRKPIMKQLVPEVSEKIVDDERKIFRFSLASSVGVNFLAFSGIGDIDIYINDNYYDSFYYYDRPLPDSVYVHLNTQVSNILLSLRSRYPVTLQNLNFRMYGGDLLLGKEVSVSSLYYEETDNKIDTKYLPGRAVNGNDHEYWRAYPQKEHYDGKDWIEVDIGTASPMNCLVVGELDYSPRLKKYRVKYINEADQECELLTHIVESGTLQIHRFSEIKARKLRIEFLECNRESNGYCEPIVSVLEAYNI